MILQLVATLLLEPKTVKLCQSFVCSKQLTAFDWTRCVCVSRINKENF